MAEVEVDQVKIDFSHGNPIKPQKVSETILELFPFINSSTCKIFYDNCSTVPETFSKSVSLFMNKPCIRYREKVRLYKEVNMINDTEITTTEHGPICEMTYHQTWEMIKKLSTGLKEFMNIPDDRKEKDVNVGIYIPTMKEYMLLQNACWLNGYTVVTCYSSLGYEGIKDIVKETEMDCIITEGGKLKLFSYMKNECPKLKKIIHVDMVNDLKPMDEHFEIKSFDVVMKMGEDKEYQPKLPSPDDLAFILYTSGSSGKPKGVMLTHKCVVAHSLIIKERIKIKADDVYLSYLPMAHVMEQTFQNAAVICYGSPFTLLAKKGGAKNVGDFEAYKATHLICVPRIMNMIRANFLNKIKKKPKIAQAMFRRGFNVRMKIALKNDKPSQKTRWKFWEKLLFKKFNAVLGGNVQLAGSGGSILHKDLQNFFKVVFNPLCLGQGYGLTECAGIASQNIGEGENMPGYVGYPYNVRSRLISVPEMNYFVTTNPPRGEVAVPFDDYCFKGYYKQDDVTQKCIIEIDGEKWFLTGDIGQFNPNGSLSIIDRKKNLVKLSTSEYVALDHLENVFGNCKYVGSICISASDSKSHVVALILPNIAECKNWLESKRIHSDDLYNNTKMKTEIFHELELVGKKEKLSKGHFILNFSLVSDEWKIENDLLTHTMKIRRHNIYKKYESLIEKLYGEMKGKKPNWLIQ